jgi:hypothetical protein
VFQQIDAQGEQARTLRAWAEYEMRQGRAEAGQKMWSEARNLFLRLGLHAEVQRMMDQPWAAGTSSKRSG